VFRGFRNILLSIDSLLAARDKAKKYVRACEPVVTALMICNDSVHITYRHAYMGKILKYRRGRGYTPGALVYWERLIESRGWRPSLE